MNFPLIMLLLLVFTGGIWLLDKFALRKQRPKDAAEPWWIEYPKSFFPVILVVFLLRSFLVEPFKIPSGSMIPTLLVGDFILVNKYTYGVRLPVFNVKIMDVNKPQRGEVMVFRYPGDLSQDYIKRVIGVGGDEVTYKNKRLTINGQLVDAEALGEYSYSNDLNYVLTKHFAEKLADHSHSIIVNPRSGVLELSGVQQFKQRENCTYNEEGFTCKVPEGHYFMMGDNRDSSSDSRYWGFVPDENIVGKAFMIWWNFGEFKRIGTKIN